MRFFFDRCVPIPIARMVRAIEEGQHEIRHHDEDERFGPKTTDTEWMTALATDTAPLWIVISGDGRILRNKAERKVLEEVGLTFFCLDKPWPNTELYEYAWKFMKVWPKILAHAKKGEGIIFRISAGSALNVNAV